MESINKQICANNELLKSNLIKAAFNLKHKIDHRSQIEWVHYLLPFKSMLSTTNQHSRLRLFILHFIKVR